MYKLISKPSTKHRNSMDGFIQADKSFKCTCSSKETVPDAKWWSDQLNWLDADVIASDFYGNSKAIGGGKHLIEEYYTRNDFANANLTGLDLRQTKKLSSDFDSDMIGLKSIEPWWHSAADTCDFAFLTSQKPSQVVGTCVSPGAPAVHSAKRLDELIHEHVAQKETELFKMANYAKGNDPSTEEAKSSFVAHHNQRNIACSVDKSVRNLGLLDGLVQESNGTFSSNEDSTKHKLDDSVDTNKESCGDMNRSELLVALCHSQTRAREAEKLAQQACDEKDHIVDLFFRQASYLFAYRQWLRMLQLETLCLQLRSKDQLNSFSSATILRKNRHRFAKKKPGKPKHDVSKYFLAFALGLTLAGAGLFVGLTIGWFFPAF